MEERERRWIMHLATQRNLSPWMRDFVRAMVRLAFDPNPRPLTERERIVIKREVRAKAA